MKEIKEIEKAAVDYVQTLPFGEYFHDLDIERAFIAGAKYERKELLRCDDQSEANDIIGQKEFRSAWGAFVKYLFKWHDPKKELPEKDVEVLVKIDAPHNKYDIMKHNQHGWWQKAPSGGWCAPACEIIGWRPITELT